MASSSRSLAAWLDSITLTKDQSAHTHTHTQTDGAIPGENADADARAPSTSSTFDAAAAIADGIDTYGLTLEALRDGICSRIAHTHTHLSAVIQENYTSFTTLSSQLAAFDAALIETLDAPLRAVRTAIAEVKDASDACMRTHTRASQEEQSAHTLEDAAGVYVRALDALDEATAAVEAFYAPDKGGREAGGAPGGQPGEQERDEVMSLYACACVHTHAHTLLHTGAHALTVGRSTPGLSAAQAGAMDRLLLSYGAASQRATALLGAGGGRKPGGKTLLHALESVCVREVNALRSLCPAASTAPQQLPDVTPLEALELLASGAPSRSDDDAASELEHVDWSSQFQSASFEVQRADTASRDAPTSPQSVHSKVQTLSIVFAALSMLQQGAIAEAVVRDALITPVIQTRVAQGQLDDGARGSFRACARIFDELTNTFLSPSSAVFACLAAALRVPGIDLLSNAVWSPLVHHLVSSLPAFFSPAIPHVFHANYTALSTLFSRLRVFAATYPLLREDHNGARRETVAATELLRHASTAQLRATWAPKLTVYAALQEKELRGRIEKACEGKITMDAISGAGVAVPLGDVGPAVHLRLTASIGVWSALQSSVAPTVFLTPCLRSTIDFIAAAVHRYAAWHFSGIVLVARQSDAARILTALRSDASTNINGIDLPHANVPWIRGVLEMISSSPASSTGASTSAPAPSAGGARDADSWSTALGSPEALLAAARDAEAVAMLVKTALPGRLLQQCGLAVDGAEASLIAGMLDASCDILHRLQPFHAATAALSFAHAASSSLAGAVRAVPSAFRMSAGGKAMPRTASPYVGLVFKALRTAMSNTELLPAGRTAAASSASPDTAAIVRAVVAEVSSTLDASLEVVLTNVAQMQASLQWLKKPAGGADAFAAGAGAGLSDSDRIGVQLALDVAAFVKEAVSLLARAGDARASEDSLLESIPSLQSAQARVRSFETFMH